MSHRRRPRLAGLGTRLPALIASLALGGCAAAVLPAVAGASIGTRLARAGDQARPPERAEPSPAPSPAPAPSPLSAPAASAAPPPMPEPPVAEPPAGPPPAPALETMQFLYGSGEAAALSFQMWRSLVRYVAKAAQERPTESVVLTPEATLDAPFWRACDGRPPAVVFDVDETVLLNLGYQYHAARTRAGFDAESWRAWEREGEALVMAAPGARAALDIIRTMGVTVIFNTNRSAANAAATEATIVAAGLGPAKHGETLFLAGDDDMGSRKDGRRARIADRWCVIAMAGDQLGDFSDLFNAGLAPAARREAAGSVALSSRWGAGWFVMPNPVYGPALRGTLDEVFPEQKRWTPQARPAPPRASPPARLRPKKEGLTDGLGS